MAIFIKEMGWLINPNYDLPSIREMTVKIIMGTGITKTATAIPMIPIHAQCMYMELFIATKGHIFATWYGGRPTIRNKSIKKMTASKKK